MHTCKDCIVGKYIALTGAEECQNCEVGKYQDAAGKICVSLASQDFSQMYLV